MWEDWPDNALHWLVYMSASVSRKGDLCLPYELLNKIVDEAYASTTNDAKGAKVECSLVCKSFLHLARHWQFQDIKIQQTTNALNDIQRLTSLTSLVTPTNENLGGIAPYIKQFSFVAYHLISYHAKIIQLLDTCMPPLLDRLHCATYGVAEWHFNPQGLAWGALHGTTQQSIANLCKSPQLRELTLYKFKYIPLSLAMAPNLRKLLLMDCGLEAPSTDLDRSAVSVSTPSNPTFYASLSSFLTDLSYPFDWPTFTNLKTLKLLPAYSLAYPQSFEAHMRIWNKAVIVQRN